MRVAEFRPRSWPWPFSAAWSRHILKTECTHRTVRGLSPDSVISLTQFWMDAWSIFPTYQEPKHVAIALVIGTVSAIRTHVRDGAGSGITAQIGTIVFSVLILLSVGIAAMVTREFNNHGIRNTVHVDSPWGQ